jgi:hypothetical protein
MYPNGLKMTVEEAYKGGDFRLVEDNHACDGCSDKNCKVPSQAFF